MPHLAAGRGAAAPPRGRGPCPRAGTLHRRRGDQHLRRDLQLPWLWPLAADRSARTGRRRYVRRPAAVADRGMSASILPARRPHVAQYMGYDAGQPTATARGGQAKPRDVDELCKQFAGVCESAVDALEISSALEFEGWSDQAVWNRFGVPDVFA